MGAGHGQRRQQHGDGQQERGGPPEKRLQAQPEIKADAGMGPGDREQNKLHADHVRAVDPISEQHSRIERWVASIQQASKSHDPKMTGDQQRNAPTEYQVGDFYSCVAKMPALIERPKPQGKMRGCGGIKREIDDRDSPPPDVEAKPCLHRVVREIAEGMIEEMRKYVGKHDEATHETQLANAYLAYP